MEEKIFGGLRYLEGRPADFDENKPHPTLVFLHGAGTISNDINVLRGNNVFGHMKKLSISCLTFAPQCDAGTTWFDNFEKLKALVDMIRALPYVDASRIYLTGNSMGGYGSWQLAMSMNHVFAAVIPVCGGGMYWYSARLKNMPVWAFHGEDDPTVFCDESRKMVEGINKRGGHARLTTYPACGHNAWDPTYGNPEVWEWLFAQRRTDVKTESATKGMDSKNFG